MRFWHFILGVFPLIYACKGDPASTGGSGGNTPVFTPSTDPTAQLPPPVDTTPPATTTPPSGRAYPLTLTPLTIPDTTTANLSLYFSVTDANGSAVNDLKTGSTTDDGDFIAQEDGSPIDRIESNFTVSQLTGQSLYVPTVLVLDLSGSVVETGSLPKLKDAASALIDAMVPEQTMAIVTFADKATLRVPFSSDKSVLKAAIANLASADGVSTNLYGAIISSLDLWKDGFTVSGEKLTVGLEVVITDGSDTAAVKTLDDVIAARGNRRVVTVGVGPDLASGANARTMKSLGNAAFIASASYDALKTDVSQVTTAIQKLNGGIYQTNYCSPKRGANSHEFSFSVKGNETSQAPTCGAAAGVTASTITNCKQAGLGGAACSDTGAHFECCPTNSPYYCAASNSCYGTVQQAVADCQTSCVACAVDSSTLPPPADGSLRPGPALKFTFYAGGYATNQCPAFQSAVCKALTACCSSVGENERPSCLAAAAQTDDGCTQATSAYCPEPSSPCGALRSCCIALPSSSTRDQCLNYVYSGSQTCSSVQASFCGGGGGGGVVLGFRDAAVSLRSCMPT